MSKTGTWGENDTVWGVCQNVLFRKNNFDN
jgi:hypothetical protein